jgi:GMP synthase-like glutamine amidotransferase
MLNADNQVSPPNVTITSVDLGVIKEEYPTSLAAFDAIIISGSANCSYDDLPWIRKLDACIREVYDHHPRIKNLWQLFRAHQLICQSLLREYSVRIEKDSNGWEIGVKEVQLDRSFREAFGGRTGASLLRGWANEGMKLQFVHHDHVMVPDAEVLPATWMAVGSTEHCAMQRIYERGRVFTSQGHFEFGKFFSTASASNISLVRAGHQNACERRWETLTPTMIRSLRHECSFTSSWTATLLWIIRLMSLLMVYSLHRTSNEIVLTLTAASLGAK